MTIQLAEQFIHDYQQVLSDDTKRGSRRDPSLLPASKERVMKALKLEIAHLYFLNSHTNEDLMKPLVNAAVFLDSFSDLPFETSEFIEAMHQRRRELDAFNVELLNLNRSDPFYWQRVYSLLGIGSETKKISFLESVRQRLGLGTRAAAVESQDVTGRGPVGRLTID